MRSSKSTAYSSEALLSALLLSSCAPALLRRADAIEAPSPIAVAPVTVETSEPDAPELPAPATPAPRCSPASAEFLGDRLLLEATPGSWVEALDALSTWPSDVEWREVERRILGDDAFVILEWPGNDAALVVLRRAESGYCVRAVWGFSFGGLGVTLSISGISVVSRDELLVALEATALFNNPVDDLSDPTYLRRVALSIGEASASVFADTQDSEVFEPYQSAHWYFENGDLVMVRGARVSRWRFSPATGKLLPAR